MAAETSDESRRILSWLGVGTIVLLTALIGILTLLAADAPDVWIYAMFGILALPAVLVLPAWAVWGLSEGGGH